jgi:cytochrome c553
MTSLSRSWLALAGVMALIAPSQAAEKLQYNRDIRPILAENCFACHGPDSASRKASLRLDQRAAAIEMDAIVPGKPGDSTAIERIYATDAKEIMPPPNSHKQLTPAQKEVLKRWVSEGAEYQPHWSFLAAQKVPPPVVKTANWAKNPIDQFILAELEKRGLQPAPEADRRTLARRLALDITGLPPAPADVAAFVADLTPDAYERFVDKLLASPHYGEHRARYWLDAARYGDTHGIHFDNFREMWSYRDWVINAYNANQSFDRFTIEQLAGDLLPNATLEQKVATGFNRCNITTNEGGAISEEYLVLYTRDRTETASAVWMGLTTGCAVCHDHKFDPLSQKEFYSLAAFFNNTTQGAMDGNIPNTPPIIPVPTPENRAKLEQLTKDLAAATARVEDRKKAARSDHTNWLKTVKPETVAKLVPSDGLQLFAALHDGPPAVDKNLVGPLPKNYAVVKYTLNGQDKTQTLSSITWAAGKYAPKAAVIGDGEPLTLPEVGDFDRKQPFTISTWVKIPKRGTSGALLGRMDANDRHRGWDVWIENDRVGSHLINSFPANAIKVLGKTALKPNQWYQVTVSYDGSSKASGLRIYLDGEPQPVDVSHDSLTATTKTGVPFKLGQRHLGEAVTRGVSVADLRIYNVALNATQIQAVFKTPHVQEILSKGVEKLAPKDKDDLYTWWLATLDTPYQKLNTELSKIKQEEAVVRSSGTIAHVMNEKPAEAMAYVLFRGDYDKRRDAVKAATPTALPAFPADLPKNRLGLAQWLMRPEHPLTARVTVNRYWQELFGTGLVRTSGDFGITGELPSHPELLDWLAINYRENGWDTKKFIKLLVTSATYRQAAQTTKEKLEKDQHNRLLSRGPRFRMDAEMIRDYALAASGLLVPKLGGPSVKPYQPDGVWEAVAMPGSNTRNYRRDSGDNLYRRSMYTFWKRAAPPASMEIFNAPNRETCAVRRERTNTPLQALVTLNDPQFVEAAKVLASAAIASAPSDAARVDFIAQRLLARSFRQEEQVVVLAELAELLKQYQAEPESAKKLLSVGERKLDDKQDVPQLAAYTMLVNTLLNMDEVLTK